MLNDKSYGLIDDLTIQYNGNQRKSIPLKVWSDDGKNIIEYVYAADGRKLQTRHSKKSGSATVRDFRGALEVVNGDIDRINFKGGFYSYDWIDDYYSRNYYIQDYPGPRSIKEGLIILREKTNLQVRGIRMTVSSDDWGDIVSEYTTSVTDYYPYGNPHRGGSDYKYSGKYLDRTYGLDLYDYHARQQDPKLGCFTSIDPLAEKYYWISPYAYCAGDPVNLVDKDGRKIVVLGSKIFKDNYNYAVTYLKSIGAGAIIERLEKDPNFTITVTMATGKTPSEYKNGKLRWNPSQGVLTDNNYILSPAEVLNHEADHGLDDKTNPHHTENSQTDTNNQYDSKEEERVITGSEQDTAEKTGKKVPIGGTRTNHNGTPVEVENCISSKPNL